MSEEIARPENACPNCWGYYEYDEKIKEGLKDKQIDIKNKVKVGSFINSFVTNHMDGIVLLEDREGKYCPRCNTRY